MKDTKEIPSVFIRYFLPKLSVNKIKIPQNMNIFGVVMFLTSSIGEKTLCFEIKPNEQSLV